jgi:hypothetical protein
VTHLAVEAKLLASAALTFTGALTTCAFARSSFPSTSLTCASVLTRNEGIVRKRSALASSGTFVMPSVVRFHRHGGLVAEVMADERDFRLLPHLRGERRPSS